MATQWTDPKIHTDYGTLRQSIENKANLPGSITLDQALIVHRRWKTYGKLVQAGRLK